jgi:hypothetical protein
MIEGQEVTERTHSTTFCWRSTDKGSFSTDNHACIFYSFSVWYSFLNAFLSKPPADRLGHLSNRRGPQFEKQCYNTLDTNWTTGVRFPEEQTHPEQLLAHPPSYPVGSWDISVGVKRPERESNHSAPPDTDVEVCILTRSLSLHGIVRK